MKITTIVAIIVTAFCLDSLLKFDVGGMYLQLGVLLLLLIPIWYFLVDRQQNNTNNIRLPADLLIALLFFQMLAQFTIAKNFAAYLVVFSYFIIYIFEYWCIYLIHDRVDWRKLARLALLILIFSGLLEYILKSYLGINIFLRDMGAEYFENKGPLGVRMRGFYLEPNWYGLMMFSWVYLYLRGATRITVENSIIVGLCLVCLYLSDNRTTLGLLIVLGLYSRVRRFLGVLQWLMPAVILAIVTAFYVHYSIHCDEVVDRTASARLCTSGNIIAIWRNSDLKSQLFGFGFSNWGYYSNDLGFSRSNYLREQALTRRDNAEFYVFLFEMGLASMAMFAADLLLIGKKARRSMDAMFVVAIYISGFFYPIYMFIVYIVPLTVVRAKIFAPKAPPLEASSR